MLGPNLLLLREDLGVLSSLLIVCHCTKGVQRCRYFFTFPLCRSHSACLWISFRGNCVARDLVCLWEHVNLGISYVSILENPPN